MITETMTSKGRNTSDEGNDDETGTTPGTVETRKLQNTDIKQDLHTTAELDLDDYFDLEGDNDEEANPIHM